MHKTTIASVIYSGLHEPFTNVEVVITSKNDIQVTGLAKIRGMYVEVQQVEVHPSVWHIIDEDYNRLEDLESSSLLDSCDEEEYDYDVSQLVLVYVMYGMHQSYWRIGKQI